MLAESHQRLADKIWAVANKLRGPYRPPRSSGSRWTNIFRSANQAFWGSRSKCCWTMGCSPKAKSKRPSHSVWPMWRALADCRKGVWTRELYPFVRAFLVVERFT